jgi:hypothetical protein
MPDVFDARGLLLADNGTNRLKMPVLLWSKNPGHGRAHVVVLEPGKAEGRTLCRLKKKVRPYGDPYTSGDEWEGRFAREACPECRRKVPEMVHGGRPKGGRA